MVGTVIVAVVEVIGLKKMKALIGTLNGYAVTFAIFR